MALFLTKMCQCVEALPPKIAHIAFSIMKLRLKHLKYGCQF